MVKQSGAEERERIAAIRKVHSWAIDFIRVHFARGLEGLCDPRFLIARYGSFKSRQDPIYADLVAGMDDEDLAKNRDRVAESVLSVEVLRAMT